MSLDAPARVAIVGAGPIGLEAALYARFLGYEVEIFEAAAQAGANILAWGHVPMCTPFAQNASPLALAALEAQGLGKKLPAADAMLTGLQYVDRFVRPLADSDLLSDGLRLSTTVLGIGRGTPRKGDLYQHEEREDYDLQLLVRNADGSEELKLFDLVIDATGTLSQPNALGTGGLCIPGERAASEQIDYGFPNLAGARRSEFAEKRILLVADDPWASVLINDLANLVKKAPQTQVTVLSRHLDAAPLAFGSEDLVALRQTAVEAAQKLLTNPPAGFSCIWEAEIVRIERTSDSGPLRVHYHAPEATVVEVDRILAAVGSQPNLAMLRELYYPIHPATEALLTLVEHPADPPQALVTPEPHFYVLGSKSLGRRSDFLIQHGLEQIRKVFTIIGERTDLNLYSSIQRQKKLP